MSKRAFAKALALILEPYNRAERERLEDYHAARPLPDIIESMNRARALKYVTRAEIHRHCQTDGLPGMR